MSCQSLPSRERGLKFKSCLFTSTRKRVAPFAGAWIEIRYSNRMNRTNLVAPFAGAWIEIAPEREYAACRKVAPFAGAWIEIDISYDARIG